MVNMASNMVTIARKEFFNLVDSKLLLLVLAWYVVIIFSVWYQVTIPLGSDLAIISHWTKSIDDMVGGIYGLFAYSLCWYGTIIAIVLGFISMSEETSGKALNTLLVKPVYRDTIINGKLLGIFGYYLCLVGFTAFVYIVIMLVYFSLVSTPPVLLGSYILGFIGTIPAAIFLSILLIFFFCSLSMLACLLLKEKSFALFLCLLIWIIFFWILNNYIFSTYIGFFFGTQVGKFIMSLSPYDVLYHSLAYMDIPNILIHNLSRVFTLVLYCFVTLIVTYLAFLRRDVS